MGIEKLTDLAVKNAKPESKDTFLSDGGGLSLRIFKSGKKSWVFRYRKPSDKKQDKFTFGDYPDMTLKQARKEAQKFRGQLEDGTDPKQAKASAYQKNATAKIMGKVIEEWIKQLNETGEITPRAIKDHQGRWNRNLKKSLDNVLVKDIKRAQIATILDDMRGKGIREGTRKTLTTINLALDFALKRHYVEENVARTLRPKDFAATPPKPKERTLSLKELREVWKVLDSIPTSNLTYVTSHAIKLLITTGARRTEVAAMQWGEVNIEAGEWIIPATRSKNRKPHKVCLSPIALGIIKKMQLTNGDKPYVFNSMLKKDKHLSPTGISASLLRLRGAMKKEDDQPAPLEHLEPFTIHDLRRTAATLWGEVLKVQPHIIEKMINHQPRDRLVATYQRAEYSEEQKLAWLAWGQKIEEAIANDPGNVVQINQTG